MILERFYPDYYVDSAYGIDYTKYYEQGFRGVVFDIDNTLVEHGAAADGRSKALIGRLKRLGYGVMLLSNNKEARVKPFAEAVGAPFIDKAGKPGTANYELAMRRMGTKAGNTLFVGDQLFTDVWGAKRAGMTTVLTQPIAKKEEIQIVLKRYLEKIVLRSYRRYCAAEGLACPEQEKDHKSRQARRNH